MTRSSGTSNGLKMRGRAWPRPLSLRRVQVKRFDSGRLLRVMPFQRANPPGWGRSSPSPIFHHFLVCTAIRVLLPSAPPLSPPLPSPSREVQLRPEAGLSQLHLARGGGGGEGSPYQGPRNAAGAAVSFPFFPPVALSLARQRKQVPTLSLEPRTPNRQRKQVPTLCARCWLRRPAILSAQPQSFVYIYVYTHIDLYMHVYIYTYITLNTDIDVWIRVCVHAHVYAHVYEHVYAHVYIYI